MIAGKIDVSDFNFRAFFDFENEDYGVAGSNAFVLRSNFRELAAVFAEKIFQDDLGLLDARGIELAFDGEADFLFLEAIENVRFGDGVDAVVANAADYRALFDFEDYSLMAGAIGGVFDPELDVFEELRVPERLKIAAQSLFVVGIAVAGEDAGLQSVCCGCGDCL